MKPKIYTRNVVLAIANSVIMGIFVASIFTGPAFFGMCFVAGILNSALWFKLDKIDAHNEERDGTA